MSEIAIQVEQLSKKYTIGHQRDARDGLRHALEDAFRSPLRWFRQRQAARAQLSEDFWALKDVSFDVKQGEVVGVVGRNGAGKSTLLKVLSRITEPTSGSVRIRGRVASLLEVGTGFHQELTGRENIFLNGAILGMSKAEIKRKFDEIVAFSEVEKFLDTPVKRYSSGMYVRLAFAVAAHLEPEILIVDEVLAVGDAEFQKKCLGKMGEVSKTGRTILFVSHNLSAVEQLCTKAILLRSGKIHCSGDVSKVSSAYLGGALTSSTGIFDLRSHASRATGATPIITGMQMMGKNGQPTACIGSDEEVFVDITLAISSTIKQPKLALSVEDQGGRRLKTFASYFTPNGFPSFSRDCVVRCNAGRLNLGPGQYFLSVSIAEKETGLLDSLDGAARFEVDWKNNYGNGEPHLPVYGPVLHESSWSLKA